MGSIYIKRVYEPADQHDGYRILVDRLWPRGLTKQNVQADEWAKYISPSTAIRKAFGHRDENFEAFEIAYVHELDQNEHKDAFIQFVKAQLLDGNITLLYAASSTTVNHATVLRDWLQQQV